MTSIRPGMALAVKPCVSLNSVTRSSATLKPFPSSRRPVCIISGSRMLPRLSSSISRSSRNVAAQAVRKKRDAYLFEVAWDGNGAPESFQTEQKMMARYNHLLKESRLMTTLRAREHFERPRDKVQRERMERIEYSKWQHKHDTYVPEDLISAGGQEQKLEEPFFEQFGFSDPSDPEHAEATAAAAYAQSMQQQLNYGHYTSNPANILDLSQVMQDYKADDGNYLGGYVDSAATAGMTGFGGYANPGGYVNQGSLLFPMPAHPDAAAAGSTGMDGLMDLSQIAAVGDSQQQQQVGQYINPDPAAAGIGYQGNAGWQQQQQLLVDQSYAAVSGQDWAAWLNPAGAAAVSSAPGQSAWQQQQQEVDQLYQQYSQLLQQQQQQLQGVEEVPEALAYAPVQQPEQPWQDWDQEQQQQPQGPGAQPQQQQQPEDMYAQYQQLLQVPDTTQMQEIESTTAAAAPGTVSSGDSADVMHGQHLPQQQQPSMQQAGTVVAADNQQPLPQAAALLPDQPAADYVSDEAAASPVLADQQEVLPAAAAGTEAEVAQTTPLTAPLAVAQRTVCPITGERQDLSADAAVSETAAAATAATTTRAAQEERSEQQQQQIIAQQGQEQEALVSPKQVAEAAAGGSGSRSRAGVRGSKQGPRQQQRRQQQRTSEPAPTSSKRQTQQKAAQPRDQQQQQQQQAGTTLSAAATAASIQEAQAALAASMEKLQALDALLAARGLAPLPQQQQQQPAVNGATAAGATAAVTSSAAGRPVNGSSRSAGSSNGRIRRLGTRSQGINGKTGVQGNGNAAAAAAEQTNTADSDARKLTKV